MVMNFPINIKRDIEAENMFALIEESITAIRRAKVNIDMGNSKIDKALINLNNDIELDIALATPYIEILAKVENIEFTNIKIPDCITEVSDNLETYIPTNDIDMSAITNKLIKQKEKLVKEIDKLNSMLNNAKFVANAPEKVITENKEALSTAQGKLNKISSELSNF